MSVHPSPDCGCDIYTKIANELRAEIGVHGATFYQLVALQKLGELVADMEIRLGERTKMCDEKDETIKRLTRRVQAFREVIWDHLIHTDDDGCTPSGYSFDHVPDENLYDAVVDVSRPEVSSS